MAMNPDGSYTDEYGNVYRPDANGTWGIVGTPVGGGQPMPNFATPDAFDYRDNAGTTYYEDPIATNNFGSPTDQVGSTIYFDPDRQTPYPTWNGTSPTPTGGTGTPPGGNNGGSGGGGGATGAGSSFPFPTFTPPPYNPQPAFQSPGQFQAPTPFVYPEFKFDPWQAPTLEQAQNQPGYQFALEQGRKALENSAAARGVLRTGGTLKDLFSWGDKFGEQNYANVFNQNLQGYQTNRENAFDTYAANRANAADTYRTNYGVSKDLFDTNYGVAKDTWNMNEGHAKDIYDRLYQGSVAAFNPTYRTAELKFADLYNRDRDKLDAALRLAGLGV